MTWHDATHYENAEGFAIMYDGETGLWTCYAPDGEWLKTEPDCKEAMIYIDNCAVAADEAHPNNFGAK